MIENGTVEVHPGTVIDTTSVGVYTPPDRRYDRFDVEQSIMSVWGTGDDLTLVLDHWEELSEDEKLNAIMGIIELHDMRCNKLFKAFENSLKR